LESVGLRKTPALQPPPSPLPTAFSPDTRAAADRRPRRRREKTVAGGKRSAATGQNARFSNAPRQGRHGSAAPAGAESPWVILPVASRFALRHRLRQSRASGTADARERGVHLDQALFPNPEATDPRMEDYLGPRAGFFSILNSEFCILNPGALIPESRHASREGLAEYSAPEGTIQREDPAVSGSAGSVLRFVHSDQNAFEPSLRRASGSLPEHLRDRLTSPEEAFRSLASSPSSVVAPSGSRCQRAWRVRAGGDFNLGPGADIVKIGQGN
jgi:hypothetical protein